MPPEIHVASFLVQRDPRHAEAVRAAIGGVPGAEVQVEQGAKVIVTVEASSQEAVARALTDIHLLPDVMSAVMVFHQCETAEEEAEDLRGASVHEGKPPRALPA